MARKIRRKEQGYGEVDGTFLEDCARVYVRDKQGVLSYPPGYESKSKTHWSMIPTQDPVVYKATCSFKSSSTEVSACKLHDICKNFVARNLHLVESLLDFPEAIAHQIFQVALETNTFHNNPEYIKVFSESFQQLVLKHLSLKQATAFIDENLTFLQCFDCLTKLDLAHCKLGEKHEYLIWLGKVKSLESICLKDNCLTDDGIQAWTLPHRMFNSGPELLKTLDLSSNPKITDSSAKYMVKFRHLKSMNLSGTSFTIIAGIQKIMKSTNLKLVSYIPQFNKEAFTKTKGWATPLIADLSSRFNSCKSTTAKPRTSFYQSSHQTRAKGSSPELNSTSYPTLLLQSAELVLPDTLRDVDISAMSQTKKRTYSGHCVSTSSFSKRRKTNRLLNDVRAAVIKEDTYELLQNYLDC